MGKGAGIEGQNSRLWFEALRLIGEVRPRYIVIENSPILNIRGFWRVLAGLAQLGYNAEWTCLRGTQFGIQQQRKRLYCVAYTPENRQLREYTKPIFRRIEAGRGGDSMPLILPGWRERRDIPQPRTFGSANELPNLLHRLECIGDAIMPLVGMYVLECIKRHAA